jgi:WD40 repeat protein
MQQPILMKLLALNPMQKSRFTFKTICSLLGLAVLVYAVQASAQTAAKPADVYYAPLKSPSEFGLGFVAGGRTLYAGGCRTFDLATRSFEPDCRYPANTRWGHVSIDGQLLLATTIDPKTQAAVSYQIDAGNGHVRASKKGLHFAPPVAIHPGNKLWAAVRAGRNAQASETIEIVGMNWQTLKRGVYGNTRRVFDLKFSEDGNSLLVNGGDLDDGALLSTKDWKPIKDAPAQDASVLRSSRDGKFAAKIKDSTIVVLNTATQATVAVLEIDASPDEPQCAFSPDGRWFAAKGFRGRGADRTYSMGLVQLVK